MWNNLIYCTRKLSKYEQNIQTHQTWGSLPDVWTAETVVSSGGSEIDDNNDAGDDIATADIVWGKVDEDEARKAAGFAAVAGSVKIKNAKIHGNIHMSWTYKW